MIPILIAAAVTALTLAPSCANDLIWVEVKSAVADNMQRYGWYDSVKKPELSGGEWFSNFDGNQVPIASFRFEANIEGGVRNASLAKAVILDANGIPTREVMLEKSGDFVYFRFPADTIYAVLQSE